MMKRPWMAVTVLALMLGAVGPASALDKCSAKINAKDGTILVGAASVSGTLLWGNTAGTETNAFADPGCVAAGTASKCTLGTGAVAITPPPLCTLYLKDGAGTCSAFIKKCTPGLRAGSIVGVCVPNPTASPRFVDNLNGTVTDQTTCLMWEQKTGTVGGSANWFNPENVNNTYTWSASGTAADGAAFTDFLPRVNGTLCSGVSCPALGGHSDWRLPTSAELQTIVELSASGCGISSACIDTVFGPTTANFYWSSSSRYTGSPASAWGADFSDGTVSYVDKSYGTYVRAVRSGS